MFSKTKIYSKLKLRKWKKLSFEEKIDVLQEIENLQAKKLKRPVYKVVVKDLEKGVGGRCSYSTKSILIDIAEFDKDEDRFFVLATLFHEGRHAYQKDEIDDKENHHFLSKEYRWKKNLEGYVGVANSGDSISYYTMQPIERDADRYAIRQLRRLRIRFLFCKDFKRALDHSVYGYRQDKARARRELGFFYRIKIAFNNFKQRRRNKKNTKNKS